MSGSIVLGGLRTPVRPLDPANAGLLQQCGDGGEPLRMAGSEDQGEMRIGCEQARPGFEKGGFFAFERAAGYDEAQAGGQSFQQAGGLGFLGGAHIEFQVAGDRNPLRQAADGLEPLGVGLALRQHRG